MPTQTEIANSGGLGAYTIPLDINLAGSDDSRCRGSGPNGCQKDFANAVNNFLSSDAMKDYRVELGSSGYISKATNEQWQRNGNKTFSAEAQRRHFGWGLGWEINKVEKTDGSTVNPGRVFTSLSKELMSAGLKTCMATYGDRTWYFAPLSVYVDPGATELSYSGEEISDSQAEVNSTSSTSGSNQSLSSAMYFFANQFNAPVDTMQSQALTGVRALANDEALWNYVKKAVNTSLRSCCSDPDGNFIAWYPDYYGKYESTSVIDIPLVELKDLTITQSDKEFYSHVFCPGIDIGGDEVGMMYTQGVVAIETDDAALVDSAFATELDATVTAGKNSNGENDGRVSDRSSEDLSDAVSPILKKMIEIPEGDEWKYTPAELYRRYGARPAKTQSLPNFHTGALIEDPNDSQQAERKTKKSGAKKSDSDEQESAEEGAESTMPQYILPYLYALYEFMCHWAQQYQATIDVTFMPEVFPGTRVRVKGLPTSRNDKGENDGEISFYVQSVTHTMSYTSGFTTKLGCICPVGNLVSGMLSG